MKIKAPILLLLIVTSTQMFSQNNLRDSLKNFTINIVNKAIQKGKVKKIAVWDFTDMNKEITPFGSYIAEQFSVYAENVDSVQLMDRQNLKSLLREHKLKSEGFIDQNTIMELGKLKEVDAVAVGSVIMADKDFQIVVKIIETNFGRTIAANEQFFPIDKRIAAILGIEFTESSNNTNPQNTANRGYNRPINSNEQYNNSNTVNRDCEKNNTGDYCFYNNTKIELNVRVYYQNEEGSKKSWVPEESRFLLKSGESKCVYNIPAGISQNFIAEYKEPDDEDGRRGRYKLVDEGIFVVEKCKSKTYSIK